MIGIRKQFVLGLFALFCSVLFFPVAVSADMDALSSSLSDKFSSIKDVESIVEKYCDAVLKSPSFVKNSFVYNAKYSSFVYLLCENVKNNTSSSLDSEYFVHKDFKKLWLLQFDGEYEMCRSLTDDCDIPKLTSSLFHKIITDYVNMKQTNIYWLSSYLTGNDDFIGQANTFSQAYFGLQICNNEDPPYPKTCRTLQSYIKKSYNLLSSVDIFDVEALFADVATVSCLPNESYNIVVCGLYADTSASFVSFVNLVYNELFYYRLFVWYYLTALQKHPGILAKSTYQRNYTTISKKFSTEYTWIKSALSLTFRMMRDMHTAFPFHIGLLMYQESLDGFGKTLAGIAPPIYTLYDKLRNVQAPQ